MSFLRFTCFLWSALDFLSAFMWLGFESYLYSRSWFLDSAWISARLLLVLSLWSLACPPLLDLCFFKLGCPSLVSLDGMGLCFPVRSLDLRFCSPSPFVAEMDSRQYESLIVVFQKIIGSLDGAKISVNGKFVWFCSRKLVTTSWPSSF